MWHCQLGMPHIEQLLPFKPDHEIKQPAESKKNIASCLSEKRIRSVDNAFALWSCLQNGDIAGLI
jgi:hypothetical protein